MSRVYGASQRPRILLQGIPESLHQSYRDRFPTVVAVQYLHEVDQAEFDMLVTTGSARQAEEHVRVIVFSEPGKVRSAIDETSSGNVRFEIAWSGESGARGFHESAA